MRKIEEEREGRSRPKFYDSSAVFGELYLVWGESPRLSKFHSQHFRFATICGESEFQLIFFRSGVALTNY
jgi:hypothetical protein